MKTVSVGTEKIKELEQENARLRDALKEAVKVLEDISQDKYEANPWTVIESKCALRARLALEEIKK